MRPLVDIVLQQKFCNPLGQNAANKFPMILNGKSRHLGSLHWLSRHLGQAALVIPTPGTIAAISGHRKMPQIDQIFLNPLGQNAAQKFLILMDRKLREKIVTGLPEAFEDCHKL